MRLSAKNGEAAELQKALQALESKQRDGFREGVENSGNWKSLLQKRGGRVRVLRLGCGR